MKGEDSLTRQCNKVCSNSKVRGLDLAAKLALGDKNVSNCYIRDNLGVEGDVSREDIETF